MAHSSKKQNFLQGAALLTIATAVVKIIGALYKIPLKMVIGDQGFGYFSSAYQIYSVLLMISTAGLPVAMSRLISQASALGNYRQVRRVYSVARGIFLGLGVVSTALMMVFCRELAKFLNQPNAWAAVLFLGPCALLMGFISTYRGFFQGQGDMAPTSISQVLEAVFKLVIGLAAAVLILQYTKSVPLAAGGAILGVTVSCLVSAFYLYGKTRKAYGVLPQGADTPLGWGATAKSLLAIAVPITVGSAGLQLLTVVETRLYMGQLLTANQMTQEAADTVKGIYDMAMTIFNMPCAFIVPIAISVLPAITASLTLNNHTEVKATEESAARITGLICLPCSVGLCILAKPVMALLGGYTGEKLETAAGLMALLAAGIFFYGIIQYTNAVMQAHGYAHVPVVNMLVSGVVKLAVVYILVGNPAIGILGAPLGGTLCYLCIAVLNLIAIYKLVPQRPKLVSNFLRPAVAAAVMGAVVYGSYWGLENVLHVESRTLLCGIPILVGVAVYAVAAVYLRAITREDCKLLPKGDKIAKFLHL